MDAVLEINISFQLLLRSKSLFLFGETLFDFVQNELKINNGVSFYGAGNEPQKPPSDTIYQGLLGLCTSEARERRFVQFF